MLARGEVKSASASKLMSLGPGSGCRTRECAAPPDFQDAIGRFDAGQNDARLIHVANLGLPYPTSPTRRPTMPPSGSIHPY